MTLSEIWVAELGQSPIRARPRVAEAALAARTGREPSRRRRRREISLWPGRYTRPAHQTEYVRCPGPFLVDRAVRRSVQLGASSAARSTGGESVPAGTSGANVSESAFGAAQILSVLLVATMFDPWVKGVARDREVGRGWQVGGDGLVRGEGAGAGGAAVRHAADAVPEHLERWHGHRPRARELLRRRCQRHVHPAHRTQLHGSARTSHWGDLARSGQGRDGRRAGACRHARDHPDSDRSAGAEGRAPTAR